MTCKAIPCVSFFYFPICVSLLPSFCVVPLFSFCARTEQKLVKRWWIEKCDFYEWPRERVEPISTRVNFVCDTVSNIRELVRAHLCELCVCVCVYCTFAEESQQKNANKTARNGDRLSFFFPPRALCSSPHSLLFSAEWPRTSSFCIPLSRSGSHDFAGPSVSFASSARLRLCMYKFLVFKIQHLVFFSRT